MQILFEKKFKKQYTKLPFAIQEKFTVRLDIFIEDAENEILRIHELQGTMRGTWSMNVTGDYRALYRKDGDTIIIFAFSGTHSQLYD